MSFDINELMDAIEAEGGIDKTASAGAGIQADDPMVKVAEDLFAGGRMFAKGFIAELKKQAAEGATAPPSTADLGADKSVFKTVAESIQKRHQPAGQLAPATVGGTGGGVSQKKTPGDNPGVVYESVAPKQQENAHHEQAGNVGTR